MPKATIRILNEVECLIHGLDEDLIEELYEKFGFYASSYRFNPKFKLGTWDGKIRFFKKTGKTYNELLDQIIPLIVKAGYKPVMDDNRIGKFVFPEPIDKNYLSHTLNPDGSPFIFEDHQVDLINTLLKEGSGVGIAATGFGKSFCCAALASRYGEYGLRTVVIVPDKSLVVQTRAAFIRREVDTGVYFGDEKDTEHEHLISTWQSLQNAGNILKDFDVVIVDECHGAKANVIGKLLTDYGKHIAHRFGVTGTLPKDETDRTTILTVLGSVKFEHQAASLIEKGWLSRLQINVIRILTDLRKQHELYLNSDPELPILNYKEFKHSYFPDFQSEITYLQKDETRLRYIASMISQMRMNEKGNTLVLVGSISFGKKLAGLIEDAEFVYGADDVEERKAVYDRFAYENNIVAIATKHIAGVGLDIPRIFNFVMIDFGKSYIKVIQAIGRGLRKAKDKDFVRIFDITSDLKFADKHTKERISYYKEHSYPYVITKKELKDVDI